MSSGDEGVEIERVENGKRTIFRTDDPTEVIRYLLTQLIEDYGFTGRITSKVEALPDGWHRIEVTWPKDYTGLNEDDGMNFDTDLRASFAGGKRWYECRDEGQIEGEKTLTYWYECKHSPGAPWI